MPISGGKYFLLDMGREQYGDCILCKFGDKTVLIDAGHPSDFDGQQGCDSIPDQLGTILGTQPPFKLTLLVVTHAHNDHIGCLPKMVDAEMLKPRFALVADPDLGFPPGSRDDIQVDAQLDEAVTRAVQRAVAGVSEEDHSYLTDSELDAFLDAAAKLGGRYRDMLEHLEVGGTTIFKWGSSDAAELMPIYEALAGTGFDIIGPSLPHLQVCRDQIIATARRTRDALLDAIADSRARGQDVAFSAATLYRAAVQPKTMGDILIDQKGQGSALNCQSIVLKFGGGGEKVLFAGDMQFHDSEVDDLEREMENLRRKVVVAGPYRFVKTTHHTSYNGLDAQLWNDLGKPPLLAHSGGLNDDKHPERGALNALKGLGDAIVFARTDHNGQILVDLSKNDDSAFTIARGELNDFRPNPARRRRDIALAGAAPLESPPPEAGATPPERFVVPARSQAGFVDMIFAIPYVDGRVKIDGHSVEISGRSIVEAMAGRAERPARPRHEPSEFDRPRSARPSGKLGGGRDVSKLLFVTDGGKLQRNVGEIEANRALQLISDGAQCIKIDGMAQPEVAIRRELAKGKYKGVVIVGGYDVVPSQRVDVLDAALRAAIPRGQDRDEFIVWSDDAWGDVNGQNMPDLPVSRIPDARYPDLLFKALHADVPRVLSGRFGIRNTVRPFATPIFNVLPGTEQLILCAPTRFNQLPAGAVQRPFLYFMLHGLDSDGSRFWGDDPGRGVIEAINTACLPTEGLGVAFAGCCWGALTVDQRANDRSGIISPKSPESSMALSVLLGGALAFVGCTGVHYSPGGGGGFFGGPMHLAFWQELIGHNRAPAEALFEARRQFLAGMPHGRVIPLEIGIERKIYKQFTCLGLGW